ncbi:MAG: nucleoside triphosphate pyrophosphohydrolase [Hydrotalea flava]|uniref:nucleoside triphosphate pyrophosphohydrolase n=1 Tax=Hydrotalea TaxID=1004300 RepID=UPI0009448593|nr:MULTISPECIES: nucleoside triphosphate pyrophosphohydrolase [Hydrotalea]MBY0347209.1 nucleoside triphosphate pyrophosphohydrolase [Hydrotalea flava]RWZ89528.1 MAG: nucleoside triphosphate pyrophosphohydrolase [Hydrotalea sp. AMD]
MADNVDLQRLVTIMDELREKCPWDKKQTLQSLKPMTIEETYELADAIDTGDWESIKEELGDLLLHIVFYSKIASEINAFSMQDVIEKICEKLIHRHPHVYGNIVAKNAEDVKKNWEQIKLQEGKTSVLSGIPAAMPALIKATRIQEKVKQVGFDWQQKEEVWDKVTDETNELLEAVALNDAKHIEEEFGDVLFSLVNFARFLNVDPETALEKTNKKFIRRFKGMEKIATEQGQNLADLSLAEMDVLWNQVKAQIKNEPS